MKIIYTPLAEEKKPAEWQWPMRIGFLDDTASEVLLDQFRDYGSVIDWVRNLCRIVRVSVPYCRDVELLILPGSIQSACQRLSETKNSIHALCVGIIAEQGIEPENLRESVQRILKITDAYALFIVMPGNFAEWIVDLVSDLSHRIPLDKAISRHRYPACPGRPMLWSLPDFLTVHCTTDERFLEELRRRGEEECMAPPDEEMDIPKMDDSQKGTKGEVPPVIRPERYLQAGIMADDLKVTKAFRRKCEHRIDIHIGPPEAGKIGVPERFPEEKLPPTSASGHNLRISFFEPGLMKQPAVGRLFLPKTGRSKFCSFRLYIPEEAKHVQARIIVFYKNRILQNTLLSGPVADYDGGSPIDTGGDAQILFRSSFEVSSAHSDLKKRSRFHAAFLLNHAGETPGVYQVKDDQSLFVRLDSAAIDDLVAQVENVINRSEWDLPEFNGLMGQGTTDLLRELAWAGSSLYQGVIKRIDPGFAAATAPGNGVVKKIQVVSANVSGRMPFEFIYDFPAPDTSAPVCPSASEALKKGRCETCSARNENPARVICPLGFWCMNRVIEWHAFTEESARSTQNAPFLLKAGGDEHQGQLKVMKDPLVGYSDRVTQAQPDSMDELQKSFSRVGTASPRIVNSWDQWKENVALHRPTLEVLLIHTEKEGTRTMIEIGNDRISTLNLEGYITDKASWPAVVLLLGCGTGTSKVQFQSVAAMVEACHAAIIVSTTSDVFGPIASRLAAYFIDQLGKIKNHQTFGEVMLSIRRRALADGISMILCLRSYGDADWRLIK